MDVTKNKANMATPFPANLFTIQMIISPNFHFCLNAHLNFSLMFWELTSLLN